MAGDRFRMMPLGKMLAYALIVEVYNLVVTMFDYYLRTGSAFGNRNRVEILYMFMYNMIPDFIIIFLTFMIVFYSPSGRLYGKHLAVKIAADIICVGVVSFLVNKVTYAIYTCFNPELTIDWAAVLMNSTLILLITEILYYTYNYKKTLTEAEENRRLALQYQYDVLKAQINPHFLFNSLNILYSLTGTDPERSRDFILSLSKMYRCVMSRQDKQLTTLMEEIDFLKAYVSVLEVRYYDQLRIEITGEENAAGHSVVPSTLQLLVENAVKHNVVSTKNPMTVTICIGIDGICVSNPIRFREPESRTGIGLNYIRKQYALYGKHISVKDSGDVFIVKVPFV